MESCYSFENSEKYVENEDNKIKEFNNSKTKTKWKSLNFNNGESFTFENADLQILHQKSNTFDKITLKNEKTLKELLTTSNFKNNNLDLAKAFGNNENKSERILKSFQNKNEKKDNVITKRKDFEEIIKCKIKSKRSLRYILDKEMKLSCDNINIETKNINDKQNRSMK